MFDIKKLLKTAAASPLMGIVVLLIGVICVIAIGSTVLTEINTSTADVTSAFYIADLGTQWTTIVGLVFVAVLALVGYKPELRLCLPKSSLSACSGVTPNKLIKSGIRRIDINSIYI